jgi:hypothetical protein
MAAPFPDEDESMDSHTIALTPPGTVPVCAHLVLRVAHWHTQPQKVQACCQDPAGMET